MKTEFKNRTLYFPNYNVLVLIIVTFLWSDVNAQQLAFPSAEGYGRFASGGRGGMVYHVTNLKDGGPGSLRFGIEMAETRTIVFDLSGTIHLKSTLIIKNPNITIAGQTAPGDGITLKAYPFVVEADNVIVRYIRSRLGDNEDYQGDAISIVKGTNIIFDHVSASWSVDEVFSCQSSKVDSLTVQWCLISEALNNSVHEKGKHGYGGIIGGLRQTFHHNLYAHHNSRSPKVTGRRHCEVDFRNNVIYNWGRNNCYDGTASYMNWVNNYYKSGPATSEKVKRRIFQLSDGKIENYKINSPEDSENYETTLYVAGNFVEGYPKVTKNNKLGVDYYDGASAKRNLTEQPCVDAPGLPSETTAEECYPLVVKYAGASFARDSVDYRIVNEVINGTYTYGDKGIINDESEVGGWPILISKNAPKDTDRDGMPDKWETENGLNPDDPDDRNDAADNGGYTNLEVYLNNIVSDMILNVSN